MASTDAAGRDYTYPNDDRTAPFPTLTGQAQGWATPQARDHVALSKAVMLFPTPSAQTYGTNQGGAAGRTGPIRPSLETWARSPQAQAITTDGDDGLKPAAPRRLNPAFVEMLQGFRVGYTDLQHWATPSSRSRQRMPGDYSAVGEAVEVADGADPDA